MFKGSVNLRGDAKDAEHVGNCHFAVFVDVGGLRLIALRLDDPECYAERRERVGNRDFSVVVNITNSVRRRRRIDDREGHGRFILVVAVYNFERVFAGLGHVGVSVARFAVEVSDVSVFPRR